MFERLNFQMWRLRKELVNQLGVTTLTFYVYCTSYEIPIYFIYYKIKIVYITVCNKYLFLWGKEGVLFHFVEILSKNE